MKILQLVRTGASATGALTIAGFSWIWLAPCQLGGCAPLDELTQAELDGSELLDVNDKPFARLATANRRPISLDSLPPHLPQAFLAIEDQRFYSHGGVDLWRTAGAFVRNIRSGEIAEGGSTITQQLARNLFPAWLPYQERNLRRKVLEARVARQIERNLSKDRILELYLNHIYLGSGAYGIEAAAETYFGKSAAELGLAEAATLAAVPQAPSRINPKENLERATARRNLVLDQMVKAGYITTEVAEDAKSDEIALVEGGSSGGPRSAYFVDGVRRELAETIGRRFYGAGLRVHTTLDPEAQAAAETELALQLRAIEKGRFGAYRHAVFGSSSQGQDPSAYLQGAVVVLDAATGEVRALVGGRDFTDSKFNRAIHALRQPGSTFKPFIYASALEHNRSPLHQVEDAPLRLTLSGGGVWEPRDYTGDYNGRITMREALSRSRNAATVRLAEEIGLDAPIRLAHDLGITSDIPNIPATALGAAEVRPIELVAAYAAFANGGHRVEPYLIRKVVDRHGRVLWEARSDRKQVIDPAVAFVLTTMLRDVVDRGTGTGVRAVGFRGPAAGKTGTTNGAADTWFVGYTPDLVAGVWIGLDRPETIVPEASGDTLAAPVWGRIMRRIYASRELPQGWRRPGGVVTAEVDRTTGAVVSDRCPAVGPTYTEYFVGSVPRQLSCPHHQPPLRYPDADTIGLEDAPADSSPGNPSPRDVVRTPGTELEPEPGPNVTAEPTRPDTAKPDIQLEDSLRRNDASEDPDRPVVDAPLNRIPDSASDPPAPTLPNTLNRVDRSEPEPEVADEGAPPRLLGAPSRPDAGQYRHTEPRVENVVHQGIASRMPPPQRGAGGRRSHFNHRSSK